MPTGQTGPTDLPKSADQKIFGPALNWWRETFFERGRLPSRSDLTPDRLTPAALPYAILIDVNDGGQKLHWRLVGTAHVERNKRDLRGASFDDVYAPGSSILAYIKELHRDLVLMRRPIWAANHVVHRESQFGTGYPLNVQRLMLPLSANGDDVNLCLTMLMVAYNQEAGSSYSDQWRNSDYIGEIERFILPSRELECVA